MSINPDSYNISHFSYLGLEQADLCITGSQDGSIQGLPPPVACSSFPLNQDWIVAPRPGPPTMKRRMSRAMPLQLPQYSVQNIHSGLYMTPSQETSIVVTPTTIERAYELQLSRSPYYWHLVQSDMSYRIVSEDQQAILAMDVQKRPEAPLYLSTNLEDLTQLWTFVPTWRDTPVACGTFHIRNELAQASVDLYYSLRADNTPVTVYQHHGGTNQMWKLTINPLTSCYWIQSSASSTYLSFLKDSTSHPPVIGHSNPTDWVLVETGDGLFKIQAAGTGLFVDLKDEQVDGGTKLCLSSVRDSRGQQFSFESAKPLSRKRSNASFKVFSLLGSKARTKSSASLRPADSTELS